MNAGTIIISVNAQGLRALMRELAGLDIARKSFVLCMKGIEIDSGKRLSEIVAEYAPFCHRVWLGPATCRILRRNPKLHGYRQRG